MYMTTRWYGLNEIKNSTVNSKFQDELDCYITEYYKKIVSLLHKSEIDILDLMYVLVCDSYFINRQRHMWVIVVGYCIITLYGYIGFSCSEYKYFYLNKITEIMRTICYDIESDTGKKFLISCGLFLGAAYGVYKAMC